MQKELAEIRKIQALYKKRLGYENEEEHSHDISNFSNQFDRKNESKNSDPVKLYDASSKGSEMYSQKIVNHN